MVPISIVGPPWVAVATLVVGLGAAVLEGSEVLGFVEAMPAVDGASFLPQAIQPGDDHPEEPQPPILQPVLVKAMPTVSPKASERTIRVRGNMQYIVGSPFPNPPVPRRLFGETGDVFEQRNILSAGRSIETRMRSVRTVSSLWMLRPAEPVLCSQTTQIALKSNPALSARLPGRRIRGGILDGCRRCVNSNYEPASGGAAVREARSPSAGEPQSLPRSCRRASEQMRRKPTPPFERNIPSRSEIDEVG